MVNTKFYFIFPIKHYPKLVSKLILIIVNFINIAIAVFVKSLFVKHYKCYAIETTLSKLTNVCCHEQKMLQKTKYSDIKWVKMF